MTKLPRPLKYVLLALAIFVVAGAATLGGVAYAYKGKFYPGVRVGGMDVGGKTEAEVRDLVEKKVTAYLEHPVVVTVPDITKERLEETGEYPEVEIKTTTTGLGLSFKQEDAIAAAWQTGHQRNLMQWLPSSLRSIFRGSSYPLAYSVDQAQVTAFINTQVAPRIVVPAPAKIVVDGTTVTVEDPKPGLEIDQEALAKKLSELLASATDLDSSYLRAPVSITSSKVSRASVEPIAARLDALGNLKVTMTATDVRLQPKREQLLSWFVPVQGSDGKITLSLDQDGVSEYFNKQARGKLDTKKSLSAVVKSLGGLIDEGVSTEQLAKPVSVALTALPPKEVTPGQYTLGRFAGKYIEVNLSEQRLYMINGNTLEKTFVVSTGKWSTPTPRGQFKITSKARLAFSKTFGLYMPYWQNFMGDNGELEPGDYGFHALPYWPSGYVEGESHLGIPVSHGCVRLSNAAAAELFAWTEIGTPAVIY